MAAATSLFQLARMPLLASARPRAWAMQAGRGRLYQAALAVGLLILAALLGAFGSGLIAGFGMLAALLIGAALALPVVLDRGLAVELASRGIVTMEDLAEQAVDDLLEIEGLSEERAAELIMTARAPWFEGEDEAGA